MKLFLKKTQNLPAFWTAYEESFLKELPQNLNDVRFVVLDTETTGLDIHRDRILCIGALVLKDKTIQVSETLEIYLKQEHYKLESVKIHGIIKNERKHCCSEEESIPRILSFIRNSVLVAHHAHFDISMINKALKRQNLPPLMNKVIDTGVLYKKTLINSPLLERKESYSLDHLAMKFNISKKDRHTALGDAYITAMAFLHILNRIEDKGELSLKDLL